MKWTPVSNKAQFLVKQNKTYSRSFHAEQCWFWSQVSKCFSFPDCSENKNAFRLFLFICSKLFCTVFLFWIDDWQRDYPWSSGAWGLHQAELDLSGGEQNIHSLCEVRLQGEQRGRRGRGEVWGYNCLCYSEAEDEIGDCGAPDSSLSPCVVALSPQSLVCSGAWCRFPSKHDWDAAQFVSADDPLCEDTIKLKYWHICYDCLLDGSSQQMVL